MANELDNKSWNNSHLCQLRLPTTMENCKKFGKLSKNLKNCVNTFI